MKAVVWHGREDVRVDQVADPTVQEATDAVVRVTHAGLCGSDIHLYDKVVPSMKEGDILGHEGVGVVEAVGAAVGHISAGDRVAVPFNIACGHCYMCTRGLQSQCETTQVADRLRGAELFGYTHMYGGVPGAQAQYLRVPQAQYGPVKLPDEVDSDIAVLLCDVLPTAWQAVEYAGVPPQGVVAVFGLGPIGQMAARIALHRGASRVIGVDWVPERLAMAERHGVETVDLHAVDDPRREVLDRTEGRGADSVIDAVGSEAEAGVIERALQRAMIKPDRFSGLKAATGSVRRGGTLSISGVYGGLIPAWNIGEIFDRQITIRMGQANVRRWTDDLLPLLGDGDPLGTRDVITHVVPLDDAAEWYRAFRDKQEGAVKVVFTPWS